LVDELFRLFRHGKSLEEKKQKMVKYLGGKRVEVNEMKIHRYQSIKGKSQSGIIKINKKKVVQNIFGNYYFYR
jgi:hypothetical protein